MTSRPIISNVQRRARIGRRHGIAPGTQLPTLADAARAILYGHIVLSRRIAESGQYPAIDVEASVSRVMHEIAPQEQIALARKFRQTLSIYEHHRDLIAIGAYQRGTDPRRAASCPGDGHA